MTNRHHTPHSQTPLRPRARTAPFALAAAALAATAIGTCALTDDSLSSPDRGAHTALVDRPDAAQSEAASAQAFADRFATDFARYLTRPERTTPLLNAGVKHSALTSPRRSRDEGASARSRPGSNRSLAGIEGEPFIAETVAIRRANGAWLLSASLVHGSGTSRIAVPLVAAAKRTPSGFRITSLNAGTSGE